MNSKTILIGLGIFIYASISLIDRFLLKIENVIYIPVVIVAIVLMLIGILKRGKG